MASKLPQILTDAPIDQLMNWLGFSAKRDKTMLPAKYLVEPSQNCFIPDTDKVVPRYGSQIVFQVGNPLNVGVIGKYTKFKNFFAIEMDVKAYRDATEGEQVYVLFNGVYVPISIDPNLSLNGTGRIYFSTYTDSNLDLSQDKRIPRLCWVNGYEHSDGTGRVFSWTGGISAISTIVGNAITIPVGQTFRKLGFTENFPNNTQVHVTINGVNYFSTSVAELDTNTLTLNAAPAAAIGDIVTSSVEVDSLVAPMDMLKQNKNYMYYGNEMYRQWWMSNQFGRPSVTRLTESNAAQDDLIIDPTTNYTGTGRNIYKIVIDSVNPDIDEKSFSGTGLNDGVFDTSAYSGNPGSKNIYKVAMVADCTVVSSAGIGVGETVTGTVSNATGIVVAVIPAGADFAYAIKLTSAVQFNTGEGMVGNVTAGPFMVIQSLIQDWIQYSKNGAIVNINTGSGSNPTNPLNTGVITLTDGLTIEFGTFFGHTTGDTTTLEIREGGVDEFTWQKNNGAVSAPANVAITPVPIDDGIVVRWVKVTGHSIGDYWLIEVNQIVTRPWANFYYTFDINSQSSVRRPGEGYVYNLPSNFWTMDTFEDSMYVNTSNGDWGYTTPTLSADLLSEDISFTPLKQTGASKVLYPYLTGHNRNDLLFIDENKNLNSVGRMQLIEKVQMQDMSDFVRNAFKACSFVNGSIVFQDDKTWITSPEDNKMLCYDERTKYWQPPQFVPNLGLLTIIATDLYVHSNLNTATRSLNDPTAIGDDGVEYEVIVRSSTYDHGNRWNKKAANMAFWEGYVDEAPPMKLYVYFDVDGCSAIKHTDITPIFCVGPVNHGEHGGGEHGSHEFGGDETHRTNYARFQFDKMGVHHFYFSSVEFRCRTTKHTYEILSMGINLAQSKFNNKDYRPEQSVADLLPI